MESDTSRLANSTIDATTSSIPGLASLPTAPKTSKKRPAKNPVSPMKKRQKSEESGISLGVDENDYVRRKLAKGLPMGDSTEEEVMDRYNVDEPDDGSMFASESEATRYSKNTESDLQLANLYMLLGKVRFLIKNWIDARDATPIS
jgi:hypothetical protein